MWSRASRVFRTLHMRSEQENVRMRAADWQPTVRSEVLKPKGVAANRPRETHEIRPDVFTPLVERVDQV